MKWHVIITGIHQENLAAGGLIAAGFDTYVPMGKKLIRHARQQKIKHFPAFGRYIFVKFNPDEPGYSDPIRSTDGVIDILTNNWLPVAVTDAVIEEIRTRQLQGAFDIIPPHKPKKYKWSKSFQILKELLNSDRMMQA